MSNYKDKELEKRTEKAWRDKNKDKIREYTKQQKQNNPQTSTIWRKKNKDKIKIYSFRYGTGKRYGITNQQYEEMFKNQEGLCKICKKPETCLSGVTKEVQRLSIDHSHETGQIRGLLCSNCNRGLGMYKDSPDLLRKAALYLEENK